MKTFALTFLLAAAAWGQGTLTVNGDIPAKLVLTMDDLARMPRQTVSMADRNGTKMEYQGVALREILNRAGAAVDGELKGKALATQIVARAKDGYVVVFTLAEAAPMYANETIVVADKRDGKPLPGNQGPIRIVCPNDKEGARSVRMLESLEIVRLQK